MLDAMYERVSEQFGVGMMCSFMGSGCDYISTRDCDFLRFTWGIDVMIEQMSMVEMVERWTQ